MVFSGCFEAECFVEVYVFGFCFQTDSIQFELLCSQDCESEELGSIAFSMVVFVDSESADVERVWLFLDAKYAENLTLVF